jgi:ubiquinone/menaquinone biosynthesis C-methylase UbiE
MKNSTSILNRLASKVTWQSLKLLIPVRNVFLTPRELVKRLDLKPDMKVLEVGCGTGYFSLWVARALKKGRLVLADIQPEMLRMARRRLLAKCVINVDFSLCDGKTFDFPDHTFDRIFLIAVMGEVENKEEYLREFHRILKPDGVLSFSEQEGDPDKPAMNQLEELVGPYGFETCGTFGNRSHFTINFRRISY